MKRILTTIITILFFQSAFAQTPITITASDMPVAGDTLRYSFSSPAGSAISPGDSGANVTWDYALSPTSQGIDSYLTALQVNPLYFLTVGPTAVGYKVADSFPIPGGFIPISIQQIYTFFEKKTTPRNRYIANAFAANISGIPTPIIYTEADVWYFFPLNYLNQDSAKFILNITLPGGVLGAIKQSGYRKTRVDGWGTITTPYYTTPVSCIRVRSEIHQIDSIPLGPIKIGLPVNTVEYKWLVNGDHYPALWVTSNLLPGGGGETITSIKYRDVWHDTGTVNKVANITRNITELSANPNPSVNGVVTLDLPTDWQTFLVEIYDMQSKEVARFQNQRQINIGSLPSGTYIARVSSGANTGYVKIVR